MKIGAEKNKVIVLAVVSVVAVYTIYTQFFSGPAVPPPAPRPTRQAAQAQAQTAARTTQRKQAASAGRMLSRGGNFRPVFGTGDKDEPLDPMVVDPTLRTDLWARVKSVKFSGVERDLFRFGERKLQVAPPDPDKVAEAQKRLVTAQSAQPKPKPAAEAAASGSKAPPIKFKYYGFASADGSLKKRAFLLDGEDVLIGAEGDVFKKRYKIIRIGLNSIVVEDMQFQDQQELKLQEGPA